MRDCSQPEMKDRLPELLADQGGDAAVRAHVESCASCAADLALLREARALAVTPALDLSRIVAALPAYRPSAWRRVTGSQGLRIAAAIVFVAGGAMLLRPRSAPVAPDSVLVPVAIQETSRAEPAHATGATSAVRVTTTSPELAVGDPMTDLSEGDLRALLREMPALNAVTPTEPDAVVPPSVSRSSE